MTAFVDALDDAYVTGRRGYSNRSLIGACVVKAFDQRPFWSRTAKLIAEHAALREALGAAPSVYAIYRFKEKLTREHAAALERCIESHLRSLKEALPSLGAQIAIDGTDLPANSNSQPTLYKNGPKRKVFSDSDATTGKRSATSTRAAGFYYGYKLHLVVDTDSELPVAWHLATAKTPEFKFVPLLLMKLQQRGFAPKTASMDSGCDYTATYDAFHQIGCAAIMPLRNTIAVKRGDHLAPFCEHGWMLFQGADYGRKRVKYVCPTGECKIKTVWGKASWFRPLVDRDSARFKAIRKSRSAIERVNGRLKNEYGLAPLRMRGLSRARLHADLCILASLASALARTREREPEPEVALAA